MDDKKEDVDECLICLENMEDDFYKMECCGEKFCIKCLETWRDYCEDLPTCPKCRNPFDDDEMTSLPVDAPLTEILTGDEFPISLHNSIVINNMPTQTVPIVQTIPSRSTLKRNLYTFAGAVLVVTVYMILDSPPV